MMYAKRKAVATNVMQGYQDVPPGFLSYIDGFFASDEDHCSWYAPR